MGIRVVLADDSVLALEGLMAILAGADGIEIVATARTRGAARHEVETHEPDVLVSDIRMPPAHVDEGIALAAELREGRPAMGVVILSSYAEPQYALRLFESGSDGRAYLLKDRIGNRAELVDAIEAVARGDSVVDPKVVETLVAARRRQEASPLRDLTPREIEVLAQVAEGRSNAAIAASLYLTKRAVEKHNNAIFVKLGLSYAPDAEAISPRVKAALLFLAGDGAAS